MTLKDDIFTTDDDKGALMICTPSDRLYISNACSTDDHQMAPKTDDQNTMESTTNAQPSARTARNDAT